MSIKTETNTKASTDPDVNYDGTWTDSGTDTPASSLLQADAATSAMSITGLIGKYLGIHFELGLNNGIAKINVYNTSVQVADIGDTHTNTTLDSLVDTTGVTAGMLIKGTGIPIGTEVLTIDSTVQVTMSKAATATASDIAVTFSQHDVDDQLIDTYISAAADEPNGFVFWMKTLINDVDTYEIVVEHNGTHNASAGGAAWPINIVKFLTTSTLTNDADVEPTLILYHTDHVGYSESYVIATQRELTDLDKIVAVAANGTDTDFQLTASTDRAYDATDIGQKATAAPTITWNGIFDPDITWGTNSPGYDDEIIDSDGHYWIKFVNPPDAGFVYFKFVPKADQYKIITTLKHANDSADFIENREIVRLLDHGIELIPHD